jgi:hypothetical protein
MASLIRLKQIESGSSLQSAADVGADFSASVYEIIDGAGLISSSAQVNLVSASNYAEFVVQLDVTMSSDLERQIVSSSLAQTIGILSQTYLTTGSFNSYTQSVSQSFSASSATHTQFSASLNDIYATDYEVYVTSSQIIDQGEF